ncbi:MAG: hypothetical protein ACOX5Z_08915 [Desulfobulbus sp.]|jgi:general secretion pathway protein M
MQLSARDRRALIVGTALLAGFALLQFGLFPALATKERLERRVAHKEKAVAEMRLLQERHRQVHQHSGRLSEVLASRAEDFSLFSFLEQAAAAGAVKEQVVSMKPSASSADGPLSQSLVEMKIQAVSLSQLVGLLERVESPEHLVGVDKIAIQTSSRHPGLLDATLLMVGIDRPAPDAPAP